MNTINDTKLDTLLSSGDDEQISPDHRAWMNEQIKSTLAKKTRGEIKYTSLDDARREFEVDAS